MKIKLDQNLSQDLRDELAVLKHDVDTVFDQGLSGAADPEVLKAASSHDRILFSLDTDFLNLRKYPARGRCGVVVFRPSRQGAINVARFVKSFVRSTDLKKHYRKTTVVEPNRTRILKAIG